MSRIKSNRPLTERSIHRKCATHLPLLIALLSLASLIHMASGFRTTSGVPRKLFGGYRITPKQCRATKTLPSTDPRAKGPTICMFNHECAQRNGEVVGACMDGFLFGACCQVPMTQQPESTLINDAQNAYYQQYQHNKIQHDTESNKIVSQAYETFAENSAQAQSQSQESAYVPDNLSEGFQANLESQLQLHTSEQTSNINGDISMEMPQTSSSTDIYSSAQSSTESQGNTSREPPKKTVQIDFVNGSLPSDSQFTQNALPPDDDNRLTFTTEIPMKIVNSLTEQTSSESESFEEDHAANRPLKPQTNDGENIKHHVENQSQDTDALYNSVTFSHSDITHPGADAVLVENELQLTTVYGPQPIFVPAPGHHNDTYVGSKKPSYEGTTTPSSITTHVDSIETIIQQLNNSNPGPAYNVINPQSSTFAYDFVNATHTPALEYNLQQSTKYNEIEQNDKQTSTPLYGLSSEESSSTIVQYADELVLEDHTMPENNYNDHQPSVHPTSDFNKMPVMGIAYPVDMSHMEDDRNSVVSDDQNAQTSYPVNGEQMVNIDTQHIQTHTNANNPHPMATYIGVVTSQSYSHPQVPKVPHEVVVSSHTTKVEGNLDSSVEYTPITTTTNKITTSIYHTTTRKPVKIPSRPNLVTKRPGNKKPNKTSTNKVAFSTSSYSTIPIATQASISPESHYTSLSYNPSSSYYHETVLSGSTTKPVATQKPTKKHTVRPVSTSYVTGPTSPRPASTVDFSYDNHPPVIATDDKLDSFVHSTAQSLASSTNTQESPPYHTGVLINADTPVPVLRPQHQYNVHKKPGFVKIPATERPPSPTVLITPKPTVLNTVASSYSAIHPTTPTTLSSFGSTSYLYSPLITKRPGFGDNSGGDYIGITTVNSNDFDDPGYYGTPDRIKPPKPVPDVFMQSSTENVYHVPSDDRPAFPGYYGPTPTYPAFSVPGEKVGSPAEEEIYTSPNDFVNFPPVRNPNLNMSATSSAVTSDFELSTPAFIEDTILKNKMNTLVHKIVESLQGNFDALSDIIDENNNTAPVLTYQAPTTASTASTVNKKPARKPTKVTTSKPKATTKKPLTRVSTKAPTKKTPTTRKPEATTKKTVQRRTTTTTRKPTRKITTTTKSPTDDEFVDEEDEEDVNPSENEINEVNEAQYGAGSGGRKLQCGVRPHIKSGRIVGGKGATFGAYPWQVLVRESTWLGLFTKNKCGGVLITNRYVITAAHCQPGFLASLVAVMGEFDISGDLESKRAVTKNVKRVIVHRQYDPATFENDIALLELESSVQFDTHIVPICMPSDVADFTGRMATVTGWGRLKYGGGVPSVLQEVQVPVIENSVCQEMFHTAGHNKKILNSFLCAGYANGQKDSCEGDSGGPLVLQRPDGRYELAGTVSHGIKCAAPYLPGVYMRTTFYKPWLRSITGVK